MRTRCGYPLAKRSPQASNRWAGASEALEEQGTLADSKDAPLAAWVTLIRWSISKICALSADKRDWSEVDDLVNQLARIGPQSPAVPLLRAELLMAQDRAAEAEKLLETAQRQKSRRKLPSGSRWSTWQSARTSWDRARQTLDEAEKKFGDRAALRLARGAVPDPQRRERRSGTAPQAGGEIQGLLRAGSGAAVARFGVILAGRGRFSPGGATLPASHGRIARATSTSAWTLRPGRPRPKMSS